MKIPNLLLIAGTGNKSGKTTLACRIIEQFRKEGVTGIKITPHFHETTPGLVLLTETGGFSIYEETDKHTTKDTSRMLKAGAERVFFAKVTDNDLLSAFKAILRYIPENVPIVCESPALRYFAEPGIFVIMSSENSYNKKNINQLLELPHVMFHLEDLLRMEKIPVHFIEVNGCMNQRPATASRERITCNLVTCNLQLIQFTSFISEISFPIFAFILSRSFFIPATVWISCFSGITGSGSSLLI